MKNLRSNSLQHIHVVTQCSEMHGQIRADNICNMQTPYIHFIYQLVTTFTTRDVVMLECRHVSLSLCSQAVSPDVVCEAIAEVLRRNGWAKAAFIGHSYGTFVLSRMVQLHRPAVESMVRLLVTPCAGHTYAYQRRAFAHIIVLVWPMRRHCPLSF